MGLAKQSLDELPSKRPSTERKKEEDDEEFQLEMKKGALERLDLMLTPTDINDPEYDFIKDQKRTELISSFEYDTLKSILRERGVHSSGNKETLLIRLLLNVIDPDMKYIDG